MAARNNFLRGGKSTCASTLPAPADCAKQFPRELDYEELLPEAYLTPDGDLGRKVRLSTLTPGVVNYKDQNRPCLDHHRKQQYYLAGTLEQVVDQEALHSGLLALRSS